MKLARIITIVSLAAAISGWAPVAEAAKVNTLYYEATVSSAAGTVGVRKMYIKGADFATETKIGYMTFRMIRNKDGAFLIHPRNRYAAKYPKGSIREHPSSVIPGPNGDVKEFLAANKARKVGAGKIDAKPCDVYEYKESLTKVKCKLWVDRKKITPVQLVLFDEKGKQATTTRYKVYKIGARIDDSKFRLPKGIEIKPMNARLANSAPKKAGP